MDGGKPAVEEVTVSGELGGEMSNPALFSSWLPDSGFHSGILGFDAFYELHSSTHYCCIMYCSFMPVLLA